MNITLRIPDELAERLSASGVDLERQALESFVLENYRAARMTIDDVRKALGFEVLDEVDRFLEAHGVFEECTVDEIDRQVSTLSSLGF